jgi:hypothetical protein
VQHVARELLSQTRFVVRVKPHVIAGTGDGQVSHSVELLLAGVPIERVSILLGHQGVRITEKRYAPWVRARQEQLEADVRRTCETPEPQRRYAWYTKSALV